MSITAVEMPRIREDLVTYGRDIFPAVYGWSIRNSMQAVRPAGMSDEQAAQLLGQAEVRRLQDAELFHVSGPMAELAVEASRSLPSYRISSLDLPAPAGLICFDRTLQVNDRGVMLPGARGQVAICAASWDVIRPFFHTDTGVYDALWITFYSDTSKLDSVARLPIALTLENEMQVPIDVSTDLYDGDVEKVNGYADAARTLFATWSLMQQPHLTDTHSVNLPRFVKRQFTRANRIPPQVRVVTLRTAAGHESEGDGHGNGYFHQWIVRGHWRQQWYPGKQTHRPVWIAPHIKGPEGAPLLGGERVYDWKRA
jgi:hypothetical protein